MKSRIKIFDTTLRDGEQAPGCSMNLHEKIEVARRLELLRVDVIEAGFAISSPGDFESVTTVAETIQNCTVASLARCAYKDIDAAYNALRKAVDPRIHVFLATSPVHMEYKLKMSPQQVLETIETMVKYAKSRCHNIEFSAEDAMRSNPAFLAQAVRCAIAAGATVINIPDTVGYATPLEMQNTLQYLRKEVPECESIDLSVHCHNDLGMATANTLAGIIGGATQVECTVNGLGERAGNAPLEEVVMAIRTRPDLYGLETNVDTSQIYMASKTVYGIIGRTAPINKPVVGGNAFAHEAGIHQHGVLANRSTYEIMTPESIGITTRQMVLGKHSGRHAFEDRLRELGFSLSRDDLESCFTRFKNLCDKKKDVTDKDILALVRNLEVTSAAVYVLKRFSVHAGGTESATAIVTLEKDGVVTEEVALGNGPVDAAYRAVDKIILPPEYSIENYVINSVSEGKDSLGEVVTTLKYGDRIFTGRGLSTDIIEASILAYIHTQNKLMAYYQTEKGA
ncbi:MAG TPA: 2-isopropylmalate synthase [Clostridiales bacterium]|nr:2-isopropylmalate synthase [Clostridiales bacterium]